MPGSIPAAYPNEGKTMGLGEFDETIFTEDLPEEYEAPKDYPYTREDVVKEVEESSLTAGEHLANAMESFQLLWNSLSTGSTEKEMINMMWDIRDKLEIASYSLIRTEDDFMLFHAEAMRLQKIVQGVITKHKEENDESK